MSFLTDTDIESILKTSTHNITDEDLVISPFSNDSLTPVGYDLRVGETVATSDKPGRKKLIEGESFYIPSGETALISTLENISMPQNKKYSGLIESKVTKVSKGLSHISTTVDPDWEGNLLIAVHNHSSEKFKLTYGEAFCTIVFFKNLTPSTRPCNKTAGRLDVFLEKFEQETQRAAKKRVLREYIPPFMVLLVAGIGYKVFGDTVGLVAAATLGVALSQFAATKLSKL